MPAILETRQRRQQAILAILQRQPVQRQAELVGLLQNEARQANVLYVLGMPLVVDLVDRFRKASLPSDAKRA